MRRFVALVPLVLLLVACGGGGSGSGGSSSSSGGSASPAASTGSGSSGSSTPASAAGKSVADDARSSDPQTFAKQFFLTWYDAMAGRKEAADIMSFFPDSCDYKADVQTDLQAALVGFRKAAPSADKPRPTDIDFGRYFSSKSVGGAWSFELNIPAEDSITIKAGSQTLKPKDLGATISPFSTTSSSSYMALSKKDNKLYIYEDACASLPLSEHVDGLSIKSIADYARTLGGAAAASTPKPAVSERAPTPDEASAVIGHYIADLFAGVKGIKSAPLMVGLFTPDCQQQARVYDVAAQLQKLGTILFSLTASIDDARFQKPLEVKAAQGAYSVTVPANVTEVHIHDGPHKGDWVTASQYLQGSGASNNASVYAIAVVNGKPLLSDCKMITEFGR